LRDLARELEELAAERCRLGLIIIGAEHELKRTA